MITCVAALSLRAQCSIRGTGWVELVLRGDYAAADERLTVRRWARGGAHSPPDMPAAFATVMAEVDDDAATRARDIPGGPCNMPASSEEAADELWAVYRRVAERLPPAPCASSLISHGRTHASPRSTPTTPTVPDIPTLPSAAHSGVWCAIASAAWRTRRTSAVCSPPMWRAVLDTLVAPLRGDNPDAWPLMDRMNVLGVSSSDPHMR